jgi:hypothetical protein
MRFRRVQAGRQSVQGLAHAFGDAHLNALPPQVLAQQGGCHQMLAARLQQLAKLHHSGL